MELPKLIEILKPHIKNIVIQVLSQEIPKYIEQINRNNGNNNGKSTMIQESKNPENVKKYFKKGAFSNEHHQKIGISDFFSEQSERWHELYEDDDNKK